MGLFPTFEVPAIVDEAESLAPNYKESIYFDINKGDIVLDGSGCVKVADDRSAWLQWCMKMLVSERHTLLAYPSDIGVEMENISELADKKAQEVAIENTIRETLMNDPSHRTVDVADFEFFYEPDGIEVKFCVVGADGYVGNFTFELEG